MSNEKNERYIRNGIEFRKSTKCEDKNCVMVGQADDETVVCDSKNDGGPVMSVRGGSWSAFKKSVCASRFDR